MTRATRFGSYAGIFTVLYFLAYFSFLPVPFIAVETAEKILPVIPWWLLVSFGSYSLGSLGWGLMTFRDCPEAYEELLSEISQARAELKTGGVDVD